MNDSPPVRLCEAFDDPVPLPDALTMVELIDKAKRYASFDKCEYEWLHILLEELWYSQEFRTRMRLYALESELRSRREEAKKAETEPPCPSVALN